MSEKPSNVADEIFEAIQQARNASQGTKQLEKSKEMTTYRSQLTATLRNWADSRNRRAAHTVLNLVQAMNKASGVNLDLDGLKIAIPPESWTAMMEAYMAWQQLTEQIMLEKVVDVADSKRPAAPAKAVSQMDQLGMALAEAVRTKDKAKQTELMQKIAELE